MCCNVPKMPDTMKEIVKSSTSSDASLLFAATGHLKDLLHQKDSGPVSYMCCMLSILSLTHCKLYFFPVLRYNNEAEDS